MIPARDMAEVTAHLTRRDALGDADDEAHARVGRLEHRVAREARRHEEHGDVGTGVADGRCHAVEHRHAVDDLAALAGRRAGDHVGAGGAHAARVEGALAAGDALDQHAAGLVDEDGHQSASPPAACPPAAASADAFAAATTRRTASSALGATVRPSSAASASTSRPASAALPSRRTTTGTLTSAVPNTSISPRATSSQRVMPPKMLTSSARAVPADRITSSAAATTSARAPPTMSQKSAALPPASAIWSMVLITSPAPLPSTPISPSSGTNASPALRALPSRSSSAASPPRSVWR